MPDITLKDVRDKYPQYSDMSDEQLVKGLHDKFYSDMPFDQFSKKVGYEAKQTDMMAPADVAKQRAGYRARLAGVGDQGPGTEGFSAPGPEGGLGQQLVGMAKGAPLAAYAGVAGLPGVSSVLPSGQTVAEKLYGPAATPAEKSGRESGMMIGMGPVGGALLGPVERALGKAGGAISEIAGAIPLKAARAVEKDIAPATSASEVGEKLESKIGNKLSELIESRRKEFEAVKDAYLNAGRKSETQILDDYRNVIRNYYSKNASSMSPDERKLMERAYERLSERPMSLTEKGGKSVSPGFDAIEKERRFLNDVAKGLQFEGAEAIPAEFARKLSGMLEGSIGKFAPNELNQFKKSYAELSEPVNRYNTALGKSVTARADEYLPEVSKIDPSKIPNKFFSSKRSINELRALSGDENFVQQVAREHVANNLRSLKSGDDITKYITKNHDWLQELPELRSELETVASRVRRGESVKTAAKWIAGLSGAYVLGSGATKGLSRIIGD